METPNTDSVRLVGTPLARLLFESGDTEDRERAVALGERWRDEVREALTREAAVPAWDETLRESAVEVVVPAAVIDAVRLLAVLADKQEYAWPDQVPPDLGSIRPWREGATTGFDTTPLAQIVVPEVWVPGPAFFATCRTRVPSGELVAGSLAGLLEQLQLLEGRTFQRGPFDPDADPSGSFGEHPADRGFVRCACIGIETLAAAANAARRAGLPLIRVDESA